MTCICKFLILIRLFIRVQITKRLTTVFIIFLLPVIFEKIEFCNQFISIRVNKYRTTDRDYLLPRNKQTNKEFKIFWIKKNKRLILFFFSFTQCNSHLFSLQQCSFFCKLFSNFFCKYWYFVIIPYNRSRIVVICRLFKRKIFMRIKLSSYFVNNLKLWKPRSKHTRAYDKSRANASTQYEFG